MDKKMEERLFVLLMFLGIFLWILSIPLLAFPVIGGILILIGGISILTAVGVMYHFD